MYIPQTFSQDDRDLLFDFMQQYNFAALVTQHAGQLTATHRPFYLDRSRGEHGVLTAHMARANLQWQSFDSNQEVLMIFQGPHAYVTPSWYEPVPTNVPTWNMTIVHAYGYPRIIDDPAALYAMLNRLVEHHESHFEQPWEMQASEEYVRRRIGAIVGFEISITRLEGKFKLSQNRSETDQHRVIEALSPSADPNDPQVADMMRRHQR